MLFFLNPAIGKPGPIQYSEYLENKFYLKELRRSTDDPVNYRVREVRRALGEGINANRNSIENLTRKVCGTIESGFKAVTEELQEVNWRLNEIHTGIEDLNVLFDHKSDLIIEEQKITNLYLGNITDLLRIPESQKQRSYHVEQGLLFLKNAIEEGPDKHLFTHASN